MKAAGSGKWKPEMGVIAAYLTPWMFEMALVAPLPDILFSAFWMLLNLFGGCFVPWGDIACQGVRSPGQCDLASGRKTMAEHHLEEFITVCLQYLRLDFDKYATLSTSLRLHNLLVRRLVHGIKWTLLYVQQCLQPSSHLKEA